MRRLLLCLPLVWFLIQPAFGPRMQAQYSAASATAPGDATASLAELNQAFSQGKPVTSVVMTGHATWTAGNITDSGPVTLTIAPDGVARMNLSIPSAGAQVEVSSGSGKDRQCQWSDTSGILHDVDSRNCWKTMLWFLPAYSLQSKMILANEQGVNDYGSTPLGTASTLYRHLQSQFVFQLPSLNNTKDVMRLSTTDIGLDPTSHLPAVLTYSLLPDKGAETPIAVEVHFSKYSLVSGVQLPFSIQRFLNGSLQLDISITDANVQ